VRQSALVDAVERTFRRYPECGILPTTLPAPAVGCAKRFPDRLFLHEARRVFLL
jgi:hypothetical protein